MVYALRLRHQCGQRRRRFVCAASALIETADISDLRSPIWPRARRKATCSGRGQTRFIAIPAASADAPDSHCSRYSSLHWCRAACRSPVHIALRARLGCARFQAASERCRAANPSGPLVRRLPPPPALPLNERLPAEWADVWVWRANDHRTEIHHAVQSAKSTPTRTSRTRLSPATLATSRDTPAVQRCRERAGSV